MKSLFLTLVTLFVINVANAFTIRYYNKDSKKHTMEVRSNGSTQKIEFNASSTSSATVQTSAKEVEIKTECGWIKVQDGAKVTIKDGCIKID